MRFGSLRGSKKTYSERCGNSIPVSGIRSALGGGLAALRQATARGSHYLLSTILFAAVALFILRADFGSASTLPQGTNALSTSLVYGFQERFGVTGWLGPFTDWGQPTPSFPGVDPQTLLAATGLVGPTVFVRSTEFLSFVAAGLLTVWAARRIGAGKIPSIVAGGFFMLTAETPQFFEGHVQSMISLALGPLFFVLIYLFFRAPTYLRGAALGVTLFLLGSVGDLAYLYKFLFFGVPMGLALLLPRLWNRNLGRAEVVAFGSFALLSLTLLGPWLVGWALGLRPQLTTGIVSAVIPFHQTAGQSLLLSFIGFSGDNSYTHYFLGAKTYALMFPATLALYFVVPGLVGGATVLFGTLRQRVFYLSGIFSVLVAAGPVYPGLSEFNGLLYTVVPDFSNDPLLFHWDGYYVVVLALLTAVALTQIEHFLRGPGTWRSAFSGWTARRPLPGPSARPKPMHAMRSRRAGTMARRSRTVVIVVAVCAVTASSVAANWEVFSTPPGAFQFPAGYTGGFGYVAARPGTSGILSVPFGNIYERTPWGGVSASSQLEAGVSTGRNLAIFEAGTPYSLALDQLIGGGLADGYSSNLTKLLNLTGIGYVVATDYPDWNYASDPFYSPLQSYEGLLHQAGLGPQVYDNGVQSVYAIPSPAGMVTEFQNVTLYDGGSSLLYELLNQPWYSPSSPLVCLCDVPSTLVPAFLRLASALVVDPPGLTNLSAADWAALATGRTPLVLLVGSQDFLPADSLLSFDPWNASNGRTVSTRGFGVPAEVTASLAILHSHGFTEANVSVRAEAPPAAELEVSTLGGPPGPALSGAYPLPSRPLPYWNTTVVSAGINNGGQYPYNGSVQLVHRDGTDFVEWNFTPENQSFQYLNFALHDLQNSTGLEITLTGAGPAAGSPVLQILFNGTSVTVPSYVTNETVGSHPATTYGFYYPDAYGAGATELASALGNITRFVVGFESTGLPSSLLVSNLTATEGTSGGFRTFAGATVPLPGNGTLFINTSSLVKIDTVALTVGSVLPTRNLTRVVTPLESYSPDQLSARTTPMAGWAFVQLAQTYSSEWSIRGAVTGSVPVLSDVGLTGWLVNLTRGGIITFSYGGAAAVRFGPVVQGAGIALYAGVLVVLRRRRTRSAPGAVSPRGPEPGASTEHLSPEAPEGAGAPGLATAPVSEGSHASTSGGAVASAASGPQAPRREDRPTIQP